MTTQLTTLPNGLRIVSDFIPSVETATVGVWVGVGSCHEGPEINGVSHFLEHMAFKGTQQRNARQIAEEIEAVGGYLNAYTSREMTAYHARILKNDVPLALDIVADILQNSVFDAEEFAREQGVILQEIAQSNDTPDDIVFDYFQDCCFPNQPLGRPILGTAELVQSFTPACVQGYMAAHYGAEQMVIAGAGNITHDALVNLAQQFFSDVSRVDVAKNRVPPSFKGGVQVYPKDLEQAHVLFGFEGVSFSHEDYYTASLFSAILGGGMSSRLFQEIREKRGLAYSIYSYSSSYKDTGQFAIYAGTDPDQAHDLLSVIYDELITFVHRLTTQELERAKAQLMAGLMMGLESTTNRCEQAARQTLIYGAPISPSVIMEKIQAITMDRLTALSSSLIKTPSALTILGAVESPPTF